jgi:hypothetical protein
MKKSKLLKNLVADSGSLLVPHIDAYLARGKFPETWDIEIRNYKPEDPHFHPSSHCYVEPKQLYRMMMKLDPKEPINSGLRKTFDCGHMWHGYVGAILTEMRFVKLSNVERHIEHAVSTKRGFCVGSGTADLVDVEIPGHGKWLVDMKTMNTNEFNSGPTDFTMKKWIAQVNCYGDWLGTDQMMVLAIQKDSPHMFKEFIINRDEQLLDQIYDRWTYTAECLRTQTEPDQDWNLPEELSHPGDSALDVEIAKT